MENYERARQSGYRPSINAKVNIGGRATPLQTVTTQGKVEVQAKGLKPSKTNFFVRRQVHDAFACIGRYERKLIQ